MLGHRAVSSYNQAMELPYRYDFAYYEQNQETLRQLQGQADRLLLNHGTLQASWGYHCVDEAPNDSTEPPDDESRGLTAGTLEKLRGILLLTRYRLRALDEERFMHATMPSHVDISGYRSNAYPESDNKPSARYAITRVGMTTGPFIAETFSVYKTAEEYTMTIGYPEAHRYDTKLLAIGGTVVNIAMRRASLDGIVEDMYDGLERVPEIPRVAFLTEELSQLEQ